MKNYGVQKSSVLPNNFEITDSKVFVYENIEKIISKIEEQEITEYQFNLIEYDKDAEIAVVSSVGTQSQLKAAIEAGANDFIQKPLKQDSIHHIITSRFEGR